jgi:hypothetical protein
MTFNSLNNLPNILLGAMIISAPLTIGGVHPPVALALAWGAALLCASTLRSRWGERERGAALLSLPAAGMLAAALVCLLQLVPLPPSLFASLDGRAASFYQQGWALVGDAAAPWRPVSLDPARTADAAARWLALGLLAASIANMAPAARLIQRLVMAAGAATLIAGAAHLLTGATHMFGLYAPTVGIRGASTFVSTNHASAFYGLVAIAAALSIVPSRDRAPSRAQLATGVIGVLCAVGAMLFHKSAGTLLAAALCALPPLLLAARQSSAIRARLRPLGGLLGLLALGALGAIPLLWPLLRPAGADMLPDSSAVRVDMATAALKAALDAPLVGVGAGAVERVIYPYMNWSLQRAATIPTIEAEPIEWLLTLGIPAALALIASMSAWGAVMPRSRDGRSRRPAAPGQLALLAYVALISFVHFPFFTLGLSIPAVALLESGIVRARPRKRSIEPWRRDAIWFAIPNRAAYLAGAAVLIALIGLTARSPGAQRWQDDSFAAKLSPEQARAAVVAVPTDGRLHYQLARQSLETGDLERAERHAALAFALEPVGQVAMLVAHIKAKRDAPDAAQAWQALFEGRYKGEQGAKLSLMLRDISAPEQRAAVLSRATPARWEQAVTQTAQREGLDAAAELALALQAARPDHPQPALLLIRLYLANGRPELANLWAENMRRSVYPDHPDTAAQAELWAVRSLRATGEVDAAMARLDLALTELPQDPALAALALSWTPPEPPLTDAQAARLERAMPLACASGERATLCTIVQALLKERAGRVDEAAELLQGHAWRASDPLPLAQLYLRQGRCLQLRAFESQWRARRDGKADSRLVAARDKCGEAP